MDYPKRGIPGRPLSRQQKECLTRLARGMTPVETAAEMYVSMHTLKTHLYRAKRQFGVVNLNHLIAVAISEGLIPLVPAPNRDAVDTAEDRS